MTPKQYSEQEALQKAAALCSASEHCVSEITAKLERWGKSAEAQERIIAQLVEQRFIDEERYARAYARDKMRYAHWGRVKIDYMLRLQGIVDCHRSQALSELPDEEYCDVLRHLIEQKNRSVKAASDYERRGKLIRFAQGRGFTLDEIMDVLSQLGHSDD